MAAFNVDKDILHLFAKAVLLNGVIRQESEWNLHVLVVLGRKGHM